MRLLLTLNIVWSFVVAAGPLAVAEEVEGKKLPPGYELQYEQPMAGATAIEDFVFSDPSAWQMVLKDQRWSLAQVAQSKYQPAHRSPLNIALVAGKQFSDFALEVDLQQTSREYGHRDMCLFFGFQDPQHFYYVHIATKSDPHAHNIFIVNEAPRLKISTRATKGFDWGAADTWQRVRLVRNSGSGEIKVFVNDEPEPIMTAQDKTFGAGWIGFGTFDDTGMVDDIRIWAPAAVEKQADFFQPAKKAEKP